MPYDDDDNETNSLQLATDSILLETQAESDYGTLESVGYSIGGVLTSGIVQLADIPTSIGNMFAEEGEETTLTDIEGVVYKALGTDAAAFYAGNKDIIDVGGFVASSFVPGMAGIKGLNAGQEAIRASMAGKQVHPFYKVALGVAAPRTEAALASVKSTSAIENTSTIFRADALKAIAVNAQQQVLEAAAFELAVVGTMAQGEVLGELSTKELVSNMTTGVLLGAGFGTLFSTVKVWGMSKAGIVENAATWNKYSQMQAPSDALPTSSKAALHIHMAGEVPTVVKGSDEFKISSDPEANQRFESVMESNSVKLADAHRTAALGYLTDLTKGDATTAKMLLDRYSAGDKDQMVNTLLGLQEVIPVGQVGKVERSLNKKLAQIKVSLESKPITEKIVYADLVGNKTFSEAPKYVSLQDVDPKRLSIKGDTVYVGKDSYKVTPRLDHNIEFDSLAIREHEARALWMHGKNNKFFTKADSIHADDVSAMDAVVTRLRSGKLKTTEFKDGVLKVRDSKGRTTEYNLARDLEELVTTHVTNKIMLARSTLWGGTKGSRKISGMLESTKADTLRELTGIPFKVVDDTVSNGAISIKKSQQGKVAGDITLSKQSLASRSLAQNVQTLLHEYGHSRDFTSRGAIDKVISEAGMAEAKKLSKQARPEMWDELINKNVPAAVRKDRKVYLESDRELMADARLMLSVLPESERLKYPALMNEIGHSLAYASDKLSRLLGHGVDQAPSVEALSRAINVSEDFLAGGASDTGLAFYRESRLAKLNDPELSNPFELPFYSKLTYDSSTIKVDANEIRGAAKLAASVKIYQEESQAIADSVIGAHWAKILPDNNGEFLDAVARNLDSIGTSASALTASNRDYGHVGSFTKMIGAGTTKMREEAVIRTEKAFESEVHQMISDKNLALGWSALNAKVRSTAGNFVYDAEAQAIKLKGSKEGDGSPVFLLKDFVADETKVDKLAGIVTKHIEVNGARLEDSAKLALSRNGSASRATELTDVFYPIGVDRNAKPYFSYVFDNRLGKGRQHSHMLYASTPDELRKLETAILNDPDLGGVVKIKSQDAIKNHYESIGEFQLSKAVTNKEFSSELQRKGLDAPYFVESDPAAIASSLLNFHANGAKGNIRSAIELKYSSVFNTLDKAARQHSEQARSTASKGFLSKTRFARDASGDPLKDPYSTYAAEMLGESNMDQYAWWKKANESIDNLFDSVHDEVFSGWNTIKVGEKELLDANKQLKAAGYENAFVTPLTMELTNKKVSKHLATKFVASLNSALGFFVLRTDPMNAVNNMIGHNVLYNAELRDLLGLIKSKSPDAGILNKLYLDLPGEGGAKVLSHGKIMQEAIGDFWRRDDLRKLYTDIGYNLDISSQIKQLMGEAAIGTIENDATIGAKLSKLNDRIKSGALKLEKATLNRFSEEMTNFVSARTAHIIVDAAVEAGVMSEKSKYAYINTFVNRVRGTYIASQRPAMFQGPIGMSMGLFQTYQLNLMQQLFRYASSGRGNSSLYMMGLQGSIYGLNGLPLYSAINTKVVGDLEGNPEHRDITGSAYSALGVKGGDWLMYGMAANALTLFGSDDLGTNVYTRGDLNPRQITIVPVNPMDAPWFAGWTKFMSNLYTSGTKLVNGADMYSTIARGLEHNGVSRPLSGLGRALQGLATEDNQAYSTTKSGNLLASYDLVSVATGVGIAGGRTLTEARSLDALYRKKAYDADKKGDMKFLREVIKTHAAGNTSLTEEEYTYFLDRYVAKGGDITRFRGFLMQVFKDANESSIKVAKGVNNSNYGRDMQAIMGGEFKDLYPD